MYFNSLCHANEIEPIHKEFESIKKIFDILSYKHYPDIW